ncbi:Tat pathway signal sequence domain protein [Brevundimonas sp. SORGH_AS_0993]|uniref:exo-rhamnogalacturonan lyase family protein n=1 Tax=Brevundimonas sp. SORGH_AS_0993 TaxID=3041794 RepID=UPI0027874FC1|nr:Tat pathway signal sequence domain protein [Brevundimonas sp. SORGH_AS_0993]MDQ1155641.1 hypothetical protein [Brevundimonas sp. SORGH_AS_0993]
MAFQPSRRHLLMGAGALAAAQAMSGAAIAAPRRAAPATPLRWLDGDKPGYLDGTTFGVPWPRGVLRPNQAFSIRDGSGRATPAQSWPIAYWPDGSLKWSAHAVTGDAALDSLTLVPGAPAAPAQPVRAADQGQQIVVTVGDLEWRVPKSGDALISGATRAGRPVVGKLSLVALSQDKPELEAGGAVKSSRYGVRIRQAEVEQSGPVRAVIKLDGVHTDGTREWLPVSVRLYFYAGSDAVRIVHSFIFDGDPKTDFIRGLGVVADAPMTDASYNRHIRFAGEGEGVWGEAVRTLTGLRTRANPTAAVRQAQIEGRAVAFADLPDILKNDGLQWVPEWGDFAFSQLSPDGFTLRKRTSEGHAWIDSNAGRRSRGLAYVGGASGGVALGLKDFWQRAPVALDIRNAHTDTAQLTAWMWSPEAPAMDLRPYRSANGMDTTAEELVGLDITYEDYEAGWDDAHGIARTSELTLWALGATPSHDVFSAMARQVADPARLTVEPARLHAAGVFGDWSLPDTSTPIRAALEGRLTHLLDHYVREVDQRRWYGFWSYGDVMHTYDPDRHMWRYDVGGYAWDNSELSTDLWLWTSYLRTGRADVFRLAEAMTRHTGEVDVYHLGRFKGFGTRHGVQHWSDSSKQPRVSNVAYRRIYYFLTADERVGDLMRELNTSDHALQNVDISRKLPPAPGRAVPEGQVVSGFGTSWGAFIAAWLTEWERTGDRRWRDRIVNGMTTIGGLKRRWFAGEAPFDLATGRYQGQGDYVAVSHLNAVFGVAEMNAELLDLLDVPSYRRAWLEYCRYYNASPEEISGLLGQVPPGRSLTEAHSRLTAYAAHEERDAALAQRAWSEFLGKDPAKLRALLGARGDTVGGTEVLRPIHEDPQVSTNDAAQWSLAAIENLALIGDSLEEAAARLGYTP